MSKYQYKIIKCRLKTGGKSEEEIKEEYPWRDLEAEDIENLQKAFNVLDGMTVALAHLGFDDRYHMYSWAREDEKRIGKALHYFKQVFPVEKADDIWICFSEKSIEKQKVLFKGTCGDAAGDWRCEGLK